MKAVSYSRNGPADSVLEFGDKPMADPAAGEVVVKLKTSGVNPSDVKSRAGRPIAFDFIVPHSDGAGVIEAVGDDVSDKRIGERVWVWNGAWKRQFGTCAEYITVPEAQAVKLDDAVDDAVGACLGIPGLTAAHATNLLSKAAQGKGTVLVTGAASSVGHYIVQMAMQAGFDVIGTASATKSEIVVEAGAKASIDYQKEDVGERLLELTNGAGVDCIIDMDFSSTSRLISSDALRPHGSIICYGSNDMGELDVPFRDLLFKSIQLQFFLVYDLTQEERAAAIETLNGFLRSGSAKTRLEPAFPLEKAFEAHELVESGQAKGNVIIAL